MARYSYQDGIPFLVHNFGTFGFQFKYDLFDGGKRRAEVSDAQAALAKAEFSLVQQREQSEVDIENAYDQVDQGALAVNVGQQVLKLRVESAREADSSYAQGAILQSKRISAHVAVLKAEASELEAEMNLDLARNEAKRLAGEIPR